MLAHQQHDEKGRPPRPRPPPAPPPPPPQRHDRRHYRRHHRRCYLCHHTAAAATATQQRGRSCKFHTSTLRQFSHISLLPAQHDSQLKAWPFRAPILHTQGPAYLSQKTKINQQIGQDACSADVQCEQFPLRLCGSSR